MVVVAIVIFVRLQKFIANKPLNRVKINLLLNSLNLQPHFLKTENFVFAGKIMSISGETLPTTN